MTTTTSRVLSLADIRQIIRKHPKFFAAVAHQVTTSERDSAQAITQLLMDDPRVLDDLLVFGMPASIEQASQMGTVMKWLIAGDILMRTVKETDTATLMATLVDELSGFTTLGANVQ